MNHSSRILGALPVAALLVALAGCGGGGGSIASSASGSGVTGQVDGPQGTVHGGQQPVTGANIQLYAVGTSGYGSASTALLTSTVTTDPAGSFNITGLYPCTGNPLVYIVASGGNPGLTAGTNNTALVLIAALGACSSLTSGTFININELTTVAAVWALQPFMADSTHVGASSTNSAGIANAFATAAKLVNTASGSAPGATAPANATLPTTTMNALANILSACVNTASGSSSNCSTLFSNAATGGTPTDIAVAALHIAKSPASNITALFGLVAGGGSPFTPVLSNAPNDWTLSVTYTGGGLSAPKGIAVDASGNLWLPNSGNNTVSKFSNSGAAISSGSGYAGLSTPYALAVDTNGYIWVANSGNNSLAQLNGSGTVLNTFTGGGLNTPRSIAIDASGNLWVGNTGAATISGFSNAGVALSSGFSTSSVTAPGTLVIDPQ